LRSAPARRPPVTDPSQDIVQLRNGSVVRGVLGINSQTVVSEQGSFQRAEVAWVILAVPQRAGRGPPGDRAGGSVDCNRREVLLYDVMVKGEKSGSETVQRMDGEFAFSYAYEARYPRVPVTVEHNCGSGDIKIDGPTDREPHPGTASLDSYVWRDSLTGKAQVPLGGGRPFSLKSDGRAPVFEDDRVACGFDVAMDGLGAQIAFSGYIPGSPGGRATLGMSSLVPPGEDRHEARIAARHKEECNKGKYHLSNVMAFDGLAYSGHGERIVQLYEKPTEVAGVNLYPPLLNLSGHIGARDGDGAAARKLARGESFSVSSGRKTYEGAGEQGSVKAATSMTVTFSRTR
jgi:hypothetical protein